MSSVAAYECKKCGGLRFTAEGSKDPAMASYAAKHVCKRKSTREA